MARTFGNLGSLETSFGPARVHLVFSLNAARAGAAAVLLLLCCCCCWLVRDVGAAAAAGARAAAGAQNTLARKIAIANGLCRASAFLRARMATRRRRRYHRHAGAVRGLPAGRRSWQATIQDEKDAADEYDPKCTSTRSHVLGRVRVLHLGRDLGKKR